MTDADLLTVVARSQEFTQITVKPSEKRELNKLRASLPIPIVDSVDRPSTKVGNLNCACKEVVILEKIFLSIMLLLQSKSKFGLIRALH